MSITLYNRLKELRTSMGLSQDEIAKAVGVTRQAISSIEAGNSSPSTLVAMQLGQLFNCRVEDIFWTSNTTQQTVKAVYVPSSESQQNQQSVQRVAMATIQGQLIAHPLEYVDDFQVPTLPAHGIAQRTGEQVANVNLLVNPETLLQNVFLAGCDIGLGLLARHTERSQPKQSVLWLNANNREAITKLNNGHVHIAAIHYDQDTNHDSIQKLLSPLSAEASLFRFAMWEQGWIVSKGNPKGFRDVSDLLRKDIRLANRNAGAGARDLLDWEMESAGIQPASIAGYETHFNSHMAVADAIRKGLADVGVGLSSVAQLLNLDFIPLRQEFCDLVIPKPYLDMNSVKSLLHTLNQGTFRRDLQSFGPYETQNTGATVSIPL